MDFIGLDPINSFVRKGTPEDPYTNITEKLKIRDGRIVLKEVPAPSYKVVIKYNSSYFVEVEFSSDLTAIETYKVDRLRGIVYFHTGDEGKEVEATYRGAGALIFPSSRVYVDQTGLAPDKTMKDVIDDLLNIEPSMDYSFRDIIAVRDDTIAAGEYAVTKGDEAVAKVEEIKLRPQSKTFIGDGVKKTFNISDIGTYEPDKNRIKVFVGGVFQIRDDNYFEKSSTEIEFYQPIPLGIKVHLDWLEGGVVFQSTHAASHKLGGGDELNVTELAGYQENVLDKINILSQDLDTNIEKVGDLTTLNTADRTSTTNAINEVNSKFGDLSTLKTVAQATLTAAINEHDDEINSIKNTLSVKSKLFGKKWNTLGDSITEAVWGGIKKYDAIISEKHGMDLVNYGDGGTRIAREEGRTDSFVERYPSMRNDADIITVMGGLNDMTSTIPVGTMSDRVDTTFYGALHVLCEGLINKYIGKSIGFITPILTASPSRPRSEHEQYANIIKEVCGYYSIPVLDLTFAGMLNPTISSVLTNLYVDDTHPNDAGQQVIARRIEAFLESIA